MSVLIQCIAPVRTCSPSSRSARGRRPASALARQPLTPRCGAPAGIAWRYRGPGPHPAALPPWLDEVASADQDRTVTVEQIAAWMGLLLVEVSDAG